MLANSSRYGGTFLNKGLFNLTENEIDEDVRPSEVWTLNTKTLDWSKMPPSGGDKVVGYRNGGMAHIPEKGLGFFYGGKAGNTTDSEFVNWTNIDANQWQSDRLLTFDMEKNVWTNSSTGLLPVMIPSLLYVPIGKDGILVSVGGITAGSWSFGPGMLVVGVSPRMARVVLI